MKTESFPSPVDSGTNEKIASGRLSITVGGFTSAGIKHENQDAFAVRMPDSPGVVDAKGFVACLSDGVSSCKQARLASQTSVIQFLEEYYCTPDSWNVKYSGGRVLTALNSWLVAQGQTSTGGASSLVCTFSSVVFKSTSAHLFHVGDSRVYRLRNGALEQLTRDHCHEVSNRKSYLIRALGMDDFLEVDYLRTDLEAGDLFVFTTDGVHEWLSPQRLTEALKDDCQSLEERSENVVDNALRNGSDDNLTCLLVQVDSLPESDMDELQRKLKERVIPPVMDIDNRIDQFRVVRLLHSGSRSHLYLVENVHNKKIMVLKAPSLNFSDDPIYLDGFIREEWVGRRINHPYVMSVYPRLSNSPYLYLLCEYIEGCSLRQWMYDNPLPAIEKVRLLLQDIVIGVRQFQRLGMVHRDLKPENIMLRESLRPVIIDFGTVRSANLSDKSSPLIDEIPAGTVGYTAPEYFNGEKGSHVSDIFSLGVIVYELLCGSLPYEGSVPRQNASASRSWHYRPLRTIRTDIPLWIDLAVEKACAVSPSERYHAMSEFLEDMRIPNRELLAKHEDSPFIKRNPLLFWKVLSFMLLLVAMVEGFYLASR